MDRPLELCILVSGQFRTTFGPVYEAVRSIHLVPAHDYSHHEADVSFTMIVDPTLSMTDRNGEKKLIEARALAAARKAGAPIPTGEMPGEEPDFRFATATCTLGIEVTEFLRPARSNGGSVPVEEERFHKEIIQIAQEQYYQGTGVPPARVVSYFANAKGARQNKQKMARSLVEFVKANLHLAAPVVSFAGLKAPEGFGALSITSESGDWWCGECGGVTLSDIREQLACRLFAKNKFVPKYRATLPHGAPVWLLLYTTVTVSRSMPIPYGIDEWKFPFDFDRVFWFACLENQVVEIQRAESAKPIAV